MNSDYPTVRVSAAVTVEDRANSGDDVCAQSRVMAYWRTQTDANVMDAIEAFPSLLENKSLLIDLALRDFQQQSQVKPVEIEAYCEKFHQFGSSIGHSIHRALEVQAYFDANPDLLDLIAKFEWPIPGEVLEGFEVIEELGRGALARVYLCKEVGVAQRRVVVKVARGQAHEAELLGRLDHPNIVPIYSVAHNPSRGANYICMPYRSRSTLLDLVDARRSGEPVKGDLIVWQAAASNYLLSGEDIEFRAAQHNARRTTISYIDRILDLAIQLASALRHAHERGIYHGDIKPSNILLTPDLSPLLIDFNLGADHHRDGVPRGGTLAYMPPEQLHALINTESNTSTAYDVRSEVYSFGALLFHLVTGEVPYPVGEEQNNATELAKRMIGLQALQSPSVRCKNCRVNASLERLILDCIAINSNDRPQSMAELHARLKSECSRRSKLRRLAVSKPYVTLASIALALVSVSCGLWSLATRPPYDQRQFMRGQELQAARRFEEALTFFNRSIESNSTNHSAKFERARTRLLQSEYGDALDKFSRLWEESSDPRCAAYAGYCFSLQRNPGSAIPWYELALRNGLTSCGLFNNLGISYAKGRSQAGHIERFVLAQTNLEKALELNRTSPVVRGNLVQTALMRATVDPNFDAESAVSHLSALKELAPESPKVASYSAYLYTMLYQRKGTYKDDALAALAAAVRISAHPSTRELEESPRFSNLRNDMRFTNLLDTPLTAKTETPIETLQTYLDPVVGMRTPLSH